MKLDTKVIDPAKNHVLLSLSGKLKSGSLEPLEKEFVRLSQGAAVKLILDVQGVDAIDSSGVGELINGRSLLAERGGNVVILGSDSRVEMLLKLSGLSNFFPVASTREQAIELLQQPPAVAETPPEATPGE